MTSRLVVNNLEPDSGISTVTVTGNIEATKVIGPVEGNLTGNVTGNVTGTASQLETNATGANLTLSGNLGVGGTITYEDVARVDATGISTFREGYQVGPLTGIALTAYKDGSIRSTGIITATSFSGSGANLTGVGASFANSSVNTTGIITAKALVADFAPVNILINGAMQANQRGSGTLTINSSTTQYPLDRWAARGEGGSKSYTIEQVSVASSGLGVRNAMKVTSSQAATVASNDIFNCNQKIEGYNIQRFNFGEAGCQSMTLSFTVKSSVAGTHGGAVSNSAENRSYPFTYTLSANTWTDVSITIPPITSGSFNETNGVGLRVIFDMGSGDTFRGTAGQWNSANDKGATGAVRILETNAANWYVTKVQLEEGTVATPYQKLPYEDELRRCCRYFQTVPDSVLSSGYGSANGYSRGSHIFATIMRTTPTVAITETSSGNLIAQGQSPAGFYATFDGLSGTGASLFNFTATAEL